MNISKRPLSDANIKVSFEFFPPSSPKMEEGLWRSVEKLGPSWAIICFGHLWGQAAQRVNAPMRLYLN